MVMRMGSPLQANVVLVSWRVSRCVVGKLRQRRWKGKNRSEKWSCRGKIIKESGGKGNNSPFLKAERYFGTQKWRVKRPRRSL